MQFDLCVIGGCGHVGLPLSIAFALRGKRVTIYDIDSAAVQKVSQGELPFLEDGGESALRKALATGNLSAATEPRVISESKAVVVVLATPIDDHMAPSFSGIYKALDSCREYLRDGQLLILRSTLYPGTAAPAMAVGSWPGNRCRRLSGAHHPGSRPGGDLQLAPDNFGLFRNFEGAGARTLLGSYRGPG